MAPDVFEWVCETSNLLRIGGKGRVGALCAKRNSGALRFPVSFLSIAVGLSAHNTAVRARASCLRILSNQQPAT